MRNMSCIRRLNMLKKMLIFVIPAIFICGCTNISYENHPLRSGDVGSETPLPGLKPTPIPTLTTPMPTPAATNPATSTPLDLPPIKLIARSKPFFMPGEEIKVEITILNAGKEELILDPFPPKAEISNETGKDIRTFSINGKLILKPGESSTYTFRWKNPNLKPGFYDLRLSIKAKDETNSWIFNKTVARILIQYPQGALEKIINVNKTAISKGIPVTLRRIELTQTGGNVETIAKLPESGTSEKYLNECLNEKYVATYRIDGVNKVAYSPRLKWVGNNLLIAWRIDPIPSDAREIVFEVREVGGFIGHWKFWVELDAGD